VRLEEFVADKKLRLELLMGGINRFQPASRQNELIKRCHPEKGRRSAPENTPFEIQLEAEFHPEPPDKARADVVCFSEARIECAGRLGRFR
jgi:hypothetical protein